jgi:DNA repair protein RadA/Sms
MPAVIKKFQFQNIHEIEVPDAMRTKIKTNISFVDTAWGGGFTRGVATLFTGSPGAGKTTMMMLIADALGRQGLKVAYNSSEEDVRQLKIVADRLDLEFPFFCGNLPTIEHVIDEAKNKKIDALIIDSLQTLGTKNKNPGTKSAMTELVDKVLDYTKDNFIMTFIIGHVTKDNKMAGAQSVKHMLDAHAHLHLCTSPRCTSCPVGTRIICLEKNRFGIAGVPVYLNLKENGFLQVPPPLSQD